MNGTWSLLRFQTRGVNTDGRHLSHERNEPGDDREHTAGGGDHTRDRCDNRPPADGLEAICFNAHAAFAHANLNWTLGPFRYVLAGPIFHRWHHTAADRGGDKNFAATFPILDVLFGTFYLGKKVVERWSILDVGSLTGSG
jgi:hypothetical protein